MHVETTAFPIMFLCLDKVLKAYFSKILGRRNVFKVGGGGVQIAISLLYTLICMSLFLNSYFFWLAKYWRGTPPPPSPCSNGHAIAKRIIAFSNFECVIIYRKCIDLLFSV